MSNNQKEIKGFKFDTKSNDITGNYQVVSIVVYEDDTEEVLGVLNFKTKKEMYNWVLEQNEKIQQMIHS